MSKIDLYLIKIWARSVFFCTVVATIIFFVSCSTTQGKIGSGDSSIQSQSRGTYKTVTDENKYYSAKIKYPVFKGYDEVNTRIENIVMENFNMFSANAEASWTELDSEMHASGSTSQTPRFEYEVSCEPIINKSGYISVLISTYVYEGGAHGYTTLASVNYDKAQKKFISISDICDLSFESLADICRADLKKQLADETDAAWIDDGVPPTAETFSTFTYDGKKITIYFEAYQVASYAAGIQKVVIEKQ